MPNHAPLSRYLLIGIAVLMFCAALPDAELLLMQARQWTKQRTERRVERITVIDPAPFR
ncbi:MAG: hypothetical protein HYX27_11025 [Acidobacteria bacterium]|nr:hypothetical protein [Acidobacteriota bacterium]